jgi:hypothetical protein
MMMMMMMMRMPSTWRASREQTEGGRERGSGGELATEPVLTCMRVSCLACRIITHICAAGERAAAKFIGHAAQPASTPPAVRRLIRHVTTSSLAAAAAAAAAAVAASPAALRCGLCAVSRVLPLLGRTPLTLLLFLCLCVWHACLGATRRAAGGARTNTQERLLRVRARPGRRAAPRRCRQPPPRQQRAAQTRRDAIMTMMRAPPECHGAAPAAAWALRDGKPSKKRGAPRPRAFVLRRYRTPLRKKGGGFPPPLFPERARAGGVHRPRGATSARARPAWGGRARGRSRSPVGAHLWSR